LALAVAKFVIAVLVVARAVLVVVTAVWTFPNTAASAFGLFYCVGSIPKIF